MAAPTHLKKLDIIQKISSRIITSSHPGTHSAPLQASLGLEPLVDRRRNHIAKLVDAINTGQSHPFLENYFSPVVYPTLSFVTKSAKSLDRKIFRHFEPKVYLEVSKKECT